jgi:DNA-binding CsgD family transcriptional regulator
VTVDDFNEPHTPAKLDDLATRMGPAIDRMREAGSGLIRVNVAGRDGTVLYSDAPANRGHVIPLTKQEFVQALSGQVGREESNLSTPENADLKDRYHDALEVYVPVLIDGRVMGVYEIYQDTGPMRTLRALLWSLVAAFSLGLMKRRVAALPSAAAAARPFPSVGLTPRELDVLRLMTTSHTYRDIGERLVISEETVRSHVKSILRKLGQPDSTRAVVAAVKAGILDLP